MLFKNLLHLYFLKQETILLNGKLAKQCFGQVLANICAKMAEVSTAISFTPNYTFESVTREFGHVSRFPPWRLYHNDNAMQIWSKLNNGRPERHWGPVLAPVITNWLIFSGENLGQESSEEKQYQIFDSGLILEE